MGAATPHSRCNPACAVHLELQRCSRPCVMPAAGRRAGLRAAVAGGGGARRSRDTERQACSGGLGGPSPGPPPHPYSQTTLAGPAPSCSDPSLHKSSAGVPLPAAVSPRKFYCRGWLGVLSFVRPAIRDRRPSSSAHMTRAPAPGVSSPLLVTLLCLQTAGTQAVWSRHTASGGVGERRGGGGEGDVDGR